MLTQLRQRQRDANPIRVGVIGAGTRGRGVALQVVHSPGMELVFVADRSELALTATAKATGLNCRWVENPYQSEPLNWQGQLLLSTDADGILYNQGRLGGVDVIVEASGCISDGVRHGLTAIEQGVHLVLSNPVLDVTFGAHLQAHARKRGVVCTSDAGSYHGVLMGILEELELRGLQLVEAGALIPEATDPLKTPDQVRYQAVRRQLDPVIWCAQVDGTALNLEMALVSNATGMMPEVFGMRGSALNDLVQLSDRDRQGDSASLNYVIGANPSEGAYALTLCEDAERMQFLRSFRLGESPYYLFPRHQRTQHLEATQAIAKAALYEEPFLAQLRPGTSNVYAFAKRDLQPGTVISHPIGGGEVYGLIERCAAPDAKEWVPVGRLEGYGDSKPVITQLIKQGEPLTANCVEFQESPLIGSLQDTEIGLDRGSERRQATGGVALHS